MVTDGSFQTRNQILRPKIGLNFLLIKTFSPLTNLNLKFFPKKLFGYLLRRLEASSILNYSFIF